MNKPIVGNTVCTSINPDLFGGGNGQHGKDGITPHIGENGNWWIGDTDTGVKAAGVDGTDGQSGSDGLSAYQIWLNAGNSGTQADFLESLKGADGVGGADGQDGYTPQKGVDYFDGKDGVDGSDGQDGVSATHSWNGTVLTVTSASGTSSADLKGEKGDSGVYIGDGEAPPEAKVQINPKGKAIDLDKLIDDAIAGVDIPTGGGSGYNWETVFELTTTEEVSDIRSAMLTEIPNIGVFTNASEMQVICYMPKNETQETRGRLQIGIYHGGGYYAQNLLTVDNASSNISADGYAYVHCWVIPSRGSFVETVYKSATQVVCGSTYNSFDLRKIVDINETILRERCCFRFNTSTTFPVGTVVQVRVR